MTNLMNTANAAICIHNKQDGSISHNELFTNLFTTRPPHENLVDFFTGLLKDENKNETEHCSFGLFNHESVDCIVTCINSKTNSEEYVFIFNPLSSLDNISPDLPYIKKVENDYMSILESLHSDFVITDSQGVVTHVLPSFEAFYGVPSSQILGETVYDLEEKGVLNPSIVAKSLETGEQVTMLQYTKSDKYLMCSAIPIKNVNNEIVKVVSFSRDVTQYELLKQEYDNLKKDIDYYTAEIDRIKNSENKSLAVIGKSKEICRVVDSVSKISKFDSVVLLTGESGAGKTMFANMIHEQSNRSDKSFIEINCGAIPATLFESELFGYVKGAFTGANPEGKKGWIEMAEGGTLFLDEIADLPMLMQVKLLKTLDTNNIVPVGCTKPVHVDFRLITATNKNLEEMVTNGDFREDLYYRLNVITLDIPPLRDHKDDIFILIMNYLKKFKDKYGITKEFSANAVDVLMKYHWPGNIRELENVVERLFLTVDDFIIGEDDLPSHMRSRISTNYLDQADAPLPEILKNVEKDIIMKSYEKHKSTTKVAEELGISQPSASLKIKKYLQEEDDTVPQKD